MILFISDLHLSPARPAITQAFLHFLKTKAAEANTLYILGDFFDVWVGDDDDTPAYQAVARALKCYQQAGHQLYFMHGNRDFLLGEPFAESAGLQLLQDPCAMMLNQIPTLLMHGDTLCTQDEDYMAFRAMVRNPQWQQKTLAMPLDERKALAAQLRETSQSMNSLKAEDIMDVCSDEVSKVMASYHARLLIHGHTHRPAKHSLSVSGTPCERIVLGDWCDAGWYLQVDEDGFHLCSFNISS